MLARGEGKIVNQSSIVAYAHFPGTADYSATKAGVTAFTHALHRELEDTGVATLELITGGNDTDMLHGAAEDLSGAERAARGGFAPAAANAADMRAVFTVYVVLIVMGIGFYALIGLTHH